VSAVALTVTKSPALDKIYDAPRMPRWMRPMPGWRAVLDGDDVTLVTSNAVAYFADKKCRHGQAGDDDGSGAGRRGGGQLYAGGSDERDGERHGGGIDRERWWTAVSKVYDADNERGIEWPGILNGSGEW